ncbi:MAG TPA: DMT family transporter [Alphaproteobacteria bacterium]|nr:DMT family transporter [Alphaproteobacteria bacterium]
MQMTLREWSLLGILSVLWGGSFFFVAIAVKEVPPFTVVLGRVGIAAIVLFAVLRLTGEAIPTRREALAAFLIMGLLNNLIPFGLFFWAQTSISGGLASILNAMTPIFSIVVAHFVLADERLTIGKAAGVILGLLGVVVLIGADALSGISIATLGMVACLGAALSYGFASVYGRRFRTLGISSRAGACGQLIASTAMVTPIALIADRPWTLPAPSMAAVLAILALAVASTALAYVIYFRLLATSGAVNAALVTFLIPVSAILLGTTILGEKLAAQHIAGMALIAAGLLAVDGRLGRAARRRMARPGNGRA